MSTIQIADKTTLDSTKTNTTNLLTKGGIKYNATTQKYQTYNTTNSSWVDTEFGGGGGSPTIVIKNEGGLLNNKSITVSNISLDFTSTKSMGTLDYLIFEVPMLDEYTVTDGTKTLTCKVNNFGGIVFPFSYAMVSFAYGTDAQIADILDAHYNNVFDISEIWAIGDTRTVSLSAMSATNVGESHEAQDVEFSIIGFNHDDLVTPINGHTKAAITINQVNCLKNGGYMNNTNSNSWSASKRRSWCNAVYYAALPPEFKSLIKQVKKTTGVYGISSNVVTSDYCWLLAEGEIFGSRSVSTQGEFNALMQYPYFSTSSDVIKNTSWWERSPYYSTSVSFCYVYKSGYSTSASASDYYGIAPAMCL